MEGLENTAQHWQVQLAQKFIFHKEKVNEYFKKNKEPFIS